MRQVVLLQVRAPPGVPVEAGGIGSFRFACRQPVRLTAGPEQLYAGVRLGPVLNGREHRDCHRGYVREVTAVR